MILLFDLYISSLSIKNIDLFTFTFEFLLSRQQYYKYSSKRSLTNIFNVYLCLFLIQYNLNFT